MKVKCKSCGYESDRVTVKVISSVDVGEDGNVPMGEAEDAIRHADIFPCCLNCDKEMDDVEII
jgi:hypothetical protein